jgi:hypothetical protein
MSESGGSGEQLRGVLGQAAITHLAMPEQVLHHVERMLDDRPNLRLGTLLGPGRIALGAVRQLAFDTALLDIINEQTPVPYLLALPPTKVPSICKHPALLAMQQVGRLRDIADVPCRPNHRMHQSRYRVDTDVRLPPEVPSITPLGLSHLRIPRLPPVLGQATATPR